MEYDFFFLLTFNAFSNASWAAYVFSYCSSDPKYLRKESLTPRNHMCYWMNGPILSSFLVCTRLQAVALHTGPTGLTATLFLFVLFTPNQSKQMAALHSAAILEVSFHCSGGMCLGFSSDCGKQPFETAGGCDLAHCKYKLIDRKEPEVFMPAVLHQNSSNQNFPFWKLSLLL